jgi:UrcA family protein
MQIKATQSSVIAAVVFTVLSGFSSLGFSNESEVDVNTVRVSYADLDLSKEAGQEALYMRLRGAADQVCGEVYSKAAAEVREKRECFENALYQALRQVTPQITSIN